MGVKMESNDWWLISSGDVEILRDLLAQDPHALHHLETCLHQTDQAPEDYQDPQCFANQHREGINEQCGS